MLKPMDHLKIKLHGENHNCYMRTAFTKLLTIIFSILNYYLNFLLYSLIHTEIIIYFSLGQNNNLNFIIFFTVLLLLLLFLGWKLQVAIFTPTIYLIKETFNQKMPLNKSCSKYFFNLKNCNRFYVN